MKKENIILQLGVEIDTLKAHIQRLKRDNYKLHRLDVELLQQKTRQLYDMLFELEGAVETQSIASPHSKSIAPPSQKTETEKVTEILRPKEEIVAKPEKKIVEPPPATIENIEEKTSEKPTEKVEEVKAKIHLEVTKTEEIVEEKATRT